MFLFGLHITITGFVLHSNFLFANSSIGRLKSSDKVFFSGLKSAQQPLDHQELNVSLRLRLANFNQQSFHHPKIYKCLNTPNREYFAVYIFHSNTICVGEHCHFLCCTFFFCVWINWSIQICFLLHSIRRMAFSSLSYSFHLLRLTSHVKNCLNKKGNAMSYNIIGLKQSQAMNRRKEEKINRSNQNEHHTNV